MKPGKLSFMVIVIDSIKICWIYFMICLLHFFSGEMTMKSINPFWPVGDLSNFLREYIGLNFLDASHQGEHFTVEIYLSLIPFDSIVFVGLFITNEL